MQGPVCIGHGAEDVGRPTCSCLSRASILGAYSHPAFVLSDTFPTHPHLDLLRAQVRYGDTLPSPLNSSLNAPSLFLHHAVTESRIRNFRIAALILLRRLKKTSSAAALDGHSILALAFLLFPTSAFPSDLLSSCFLGDLLLRYCCCAAETSTSAGQQE